MAHITFQKRHVVSLAGEDIKRVRTSVNFTIEVQLIDKRAATVLLYTKDWFKS
jgi:hypothetical protein